MASLIQKNFRARKSFAKLKQVIEIPNLIDIQKRSYDKFLQIDIPVDKREDIGLQGVKVNVSGESVEGYNVVFGGGVGAEAGIGKQVFTGISFNELPGLLERVLKTYLAKRDANETFASFTRRHEVKQLQDLFSQ